MKEYICKEDFREFFFSPESGTEEVISDLIMKHNLDYLHDVNEEDVNSFAEDLIFAFLNVLDTEEVVTKADIYREFAEKVKNMFDACEKMAFGIIDVDVAKGLVDKVLAEMECEE